MISVIIPIYNAGMRLQIMLNDLIKQTEKEFEVLLIDDGSTDESGKICDLIEKKDSRFRVFHQENGGVSSARNRGLQEAVGEYITFMDADDEVGSEYLKELLETCERTECDVAVCDVTIIQNEQEIRRFTYKPIELTQTEALNLLFSRRNINSGPCAKLFKAEVVRGIMFPRLKAYEDILFVKDAFTRAKKITVTNKTEYRYIQNNAGTMMNFIKTPSSDVIVATEELIKFINIRKDLDAECLYITVSHLMQYIEPMLPVKEEKAESFVVNAQRLYRKNIINIWKCKAFPWKEKIVYSTFVYGLAYVEGHFVKIKEK